MVIKTPDCVIKAQYILALNYDLWSQAFVLLPTLATIWCNIKDKVSNFIPYRTPPVLIYR